MNICGRRYDTQQLVSIEVAAGRIARIIPLAADEATSRRAAAAPWISPGFIDLQINGYGGHEFNEPGVTAEHVRDICLAQDAHGIVGFCPTTTTHSFETLHHAMRMIATACERDSGVARRVIGVHLEGPYISPEDGPRGAHPQAHCRPPDWDEFQRFQDAAGGRIRIVTLSAEYDAAPSFIARAVRSGVVVAIGHTSANSDQIRAAVDAGAAFSTHLGNGAHPRIRRHPNYIWDQLADDRLLASLIVDGHHLPPSVVQSFVRAKTPVRCLLVSDITGMAGLPAGRYERTSLGNVEVLEDGRLVVAGQRDLLAGAALPITVGIANVMRFAGVDLKTAVDMASMTPAVLAGHAPGRLEVGAPADLVQFELPATLTAESREPVRVVATVLGGEVVYGTPWQPS